MRKKLIGLLVLGSLSTVFLVAPTMSLGQGKGGGKGKKGGGDPTGGQPGAGKFGGGGIPGGGGPGGGGPGGGPGGGFGGGGKQKGGGFGANPDQLFDWMSKGADVIDIGSLKGGMKTAFEDWAASSGNTTGQITREQFREAMAKYPGRP